jgi:hypothetical protein
MQDSFLQNVVINYHNLLIFPGDVNINVVLSGYFCDNWSIIYYNSKGLALMQMLLACGELNFYIECIIFVFIVTNGIPLYLFSADYVENVQSKLLSY